MTTPEPAAETAVTQETPGAAEPDAAAPGEGQDGSEDGPEPALDAAPGFEQDGPAEGPETALDEAEESGGRCVVCGHAGSGHSIPPGSGAEWPLRALACPQCPGGRCELPADEAAPAESVAARGLVTGLPGDDRAFTERMRHLMTVVPGTSAPVVLTGDALSAWAQLYAEGGRDDEDGLTAQQAINEHHRGYAAADARVFPPREPFVRRPVLTG